MWYRGMVKSPFEASATLAVAKGLSLSQIQEMFPDKASCAAFLLERRWSGGSRPGSPVPPVSAIINRSTQRIHYI